MSVQTEIIWGEEVADTTLVAHEIANDWKEVTLADVVSKLGDGLHGTPKYDEQGEYAFINGNNLLNGKIVIKETTQRANEEEYKRHRKYLNERTILVSINGTLGNVALYNNEKCILGKSACYFNVLPEVDRLFIKYVVTGQTFQEHIRNFAHGTTIQNVSLKTMREYPFLLPSLPEQRAIVGVLGSLDDKIDLLHRQNATLEALAETLFRQWFVEEAKEDWDERKVGDIAAHLKVGINPVANPTVMYYQYSLPAYDNGQVPTRELGLEILSNKYEVSPNTILISKLNPRFPRIWAIGESVEANSVCSTEFQVFKPKEQSLYAYLYFLIKSEDVVGEMTMAASGTSGSHQRIRPEDILNIKVRIPSIEKADEFSAITQGFIDKANKNRRVIQTLSTLRDTLLPKLMSGEVRVAY